MDIYGRYDSAGNLKSSSSGGGGGNDEIKRLNDNLEKIEQNGISATANLDGTNVSTALNVSQREIQ